MNNLWKEVKGKKYSHAVQENNTEEIQQTVQQKETQQTIPQSPELFKVTLCKYFNNGGRCNKGDSCTFAHGESELRKFSKPFVHYTAKNYTTTSTYIDSNNEQVQEVVVDKSDITSIKEAIANAKRYIKEYMDNNNMKGDIRIDIKISDP